MVKFVIHTDVEEEEQEVRLALIPSRSTKGLINLCAVNDKGHVVGSGIILGITADGTLMRHRSVSSRLGLNLKHGMITDATK